MLKIKTSVYQRALFFIFSLLITSCTAPPKQSELDELAVNKEFEEVIKIKNIEPLTKDSIQEKKSETIKKPKKSSLPKNQRKKTKKRKVVKRKSSLKNKIEKKTKVVLRQPEMEDSEGFDGRRPIVDPLRPLETQTFDVNYGILSAGKVRLKIRPFVEVNGKKAYHFTGHVDSNAVFSLFYKVRDWAETYVDYDSLLPHGFAVHVKESKQYKEVRNAFDWEKLEGTHWQKKLSDGKTKERKTSWEIKDFSQNVISAFFYLRTFQYAVGKEMQFRVADDGKNIVVTIKVLKEEVLKTNLGKLRTFKSEVKFEYDGVFKPVGSIYLWVTNDEKKYIARVDAKIKIGTISLDLEKVENNPL